jgi:UDP-N-acetylglucosamine--N-acetylmuramyl-(pentapeptide) pyrophosphoryl-undecaprenol N-acetylglucosamine transferase
MRAGEDIRPVVIAAGGTGGHVFPAIALAETLLARGREVIFLTDRRTAPTLAALSGAEIRVLSAAGLAGRGMWRALGALVALARGTLQALALFLRARPGAVVAFGGYPAVPPVLAARLIAPRPVVLLHEQNAVLGRANRVLARLADGLAVGFAATSRIPRRIPVFVTGTPVRAALLAARTPYTPPAAEGEIRLLVIGGSLGARAIARLVPEALALLPEGLRRRLRLALQCREEERERAAARLSAAAITAELAPFFPDIAPRLAAAHLVIARAGASTVAELAALGRPALLIPLPSAIDDHQRANAHALAARGGAVVFEERGLDAPSLAREIAALLTDPARLAAMAQAAEGGGAAAERLARLLEDLLAARRGLTLAPLETPS